MFNRGQQVPINIADPQLALANEGTAQGAHSILGVIAPSGAFHPAVVTASTAVGRTYQVTIPFDSPTTLLVVPGAFQLSDSSGNAVGQGGKSVQITAPSAAAPPNVSFVLNGLVSH